MRINPHRPMQTPSTNSRIISIRRCPDAWSEFYFKRSTTWLSFITSNAFSAMMLEHSFRSAPCVGQPAILANWHTSSNHSRTPLPKRSIRPRWRQTQPSCTYQPSHLCANFYVLDKFMSTFPFFTIDCAWQTFLVGTLFAPESSLQSWTVSPSLALAISWSNKATRSTPSAPALRLARLGLSNMP